MARDSARSVFTKRRSGSFARRPGSAACGGCRWRILLIICTKQNPKIVHKDVAEPNLDLDLLSAQLGIQIVAADVVRQGPGDAGAGRIEARDTHPTRDLIVVHGIVLPDLEGVAKGEVESGGRRIDLLGAEGRRVSHG